MKGAQTILFIAIGIAALVYVYHTQIKPAVIFGLCSDYAHAIPFQKVIKEIPRGREGDLQSNPRYDQAYQKEGVTCVACRVRDGKILGPYDDSAAPHPTEFDPGFRTTQICYRCHNAVSGPAQFYNVGSCGTYAEYEGKFFMQERGFI